MRYSKEDSNPLWRRGLDSIVLLDPESLEVKAEYPNFWAQGYTPMFANIKSDKSKIYGYSMSTQDSLLTILSIKGIKTDVHAVKIPSDHKWAGMELSTDESYMIVANACKKQLSGGQA